MSRFLWWNAFALAVIGIFLAGGAVIVAIPFALTTTNPWWFLALLGLPAAVASGYAAWIACGHCLDGVL